MARKETRKLSAPEEEAWRSLFELAQRIDSLNPWPWIDVPDCFCVKLSNLEAPCFVIFQGESGKTRHIRVLIDWKSLYLVFAGKTRENDEVFYQWMADVRMLELLFLNKEYMFDHEVAFMESMGLAPGSQFTTPVIRSWMPGYQPWFPDKEECALLSTVLYQAYGMVMRLEEHPTLLRERFPREILMRLQGKGELWQDKWIEVQQPSNEDMEVQLPLKMLVRLRDNPLLPVTVQIDFVLMPLSVQSDTERPLTTYALLVVDAGTGMVLHSDLAHPSKGPMHMWAGLAERVMTIFDSQGGCPATIEVRNDRVANVLRALGEHIPFKLVLRRKLALLDEAVRSLQHYLLAQQGEGNNDVGE